MLFPRFTHLAEVEVATDSALVPNAHNWSSAATVTFDFVMDDWEGLAQGSADFVPDELLYEGLPLEVLLLAESLLYLFDCFRDWSD